MIWRTGIGFHGAVEALRQKVPEDFGPEEAFDGGADLPCDQRVSVPQGLTMRKKNTHKLRLTG